MKEELSSKQLHRICPSVASRAALGRKEQVFGESCRTLFIDLKRAVRQWPEDLELRLLMETLQLSQDALLSSPTQLGGQLLARIHRTNSATLIAQAKDLIEQGKLPAEAFPVLNLLEAFEIRSAEKTKVTSCYKHYFHFGEIPNCLPCGF